MVGYKNYTGVYYTDEKNDNFIKVEVEKKIDPIKDGTKLVKNFPKVFPVENLVQLTIEEFDNLMLQATPDDILKEIDKIIDEGTTLASKGEGESLPDSIVNWKRALIMSWLHSRDMTVLMSAMGYPKELTGVHDIHEFITVKAAKSKLNQSDKWYIDWITGLKDNDQVDVGFFNPKISSIVYKYGKNKNGTQNGLDGHRLTAHHLGNVDIDNASNPYKIDETGIDWIERALNFVYHHLPREHDGILRETHSTWEHLEEHIRSSHLTKRNTILHDIIRDSAIMIKLLEEEGKIIPWFLIDEACEALEKDNYIVSKSNSAVLRAVSFNGNVSFYPIVNGDEKKQNIKSGDWIINGSTGWYISESNEGDPLSVKIKFSELLEDNYTLQLTPISEGQTIIQSCECSYQGEDGFRILFQTNTEVVYNKVGFSFEVKGVKKEVAPDDRTLSKDELIEDIHSISNTFRNDAEFGVVTVMCSASISDSESIRKETKSLLQDLEKNELALSNVIFSEEKKKINKEIFRIQQRLDRLKKLDGNSRYWDSAYRFGEMWGRYAKTKQKEDFGGKHVPICTGGGPGLMAAVAKGASDQKTQVVGIDCIFGNDKRFDLTGDFSLLSNVRLRCNDFAIREAALINYSHVILFWPGGYGTMWEAFETLSKIQTNHLRRKKVKAIFVHDEFWMPMYHLIKHLEEQGTINSFNDRIKVKGLDSNLPEDYYVAEFVKDENEAFDVAINHLKKLQSQNMLSLK